MREIQRATPLVIGVTAVSLLALGCGSGEPDEPAGEARSLEQGGITPQDMSSDEARRPQQSGMPAADVKRTTD
ncbi:MULTISPECIES: hypothetical protein [unclassified Thioalkalivibrio]|uniref:hypothetical protein n=1 Tax=unclassified Thioalkalivibrio TaxID=2621013 RepID=UPI00036D6873|nr:MULTISPECIES: hypothetical protein [unclassified Thioalkalivibrio]